MSIYDELTKKLNALRSEDHKPKYMILGYGKVRDLEEELSPELLRLDCSNDEFMRRGAAGKFGACQFFINQSVEDKVTILTEREVDMIKSELEFRE